MTVYCTVVDVSIPAFQRGSRMKKFMVVGTLAATVMVPGLRLAAQTTPTPKKPALAVAHKTTAPQPAGAPAPDLTKQYCERCRRAHCLRHGRLLRRGDETAKAGDTNTDIRRR